MGTNEELEVVVNCFRCIFCKFILPVAVALQVHYYERHHVFCNADNQHCNIVDGRARCTSLRLPFAKREKPIDRLWASAHCTLCVCVVWRICFISLFHRILCVYGNWVPERTRTNREKCCTRTYRTKEFSKLVQILFNVFPRTGRWGGGSGRTTMRTLFFFVQLCVGGHSSNVTEPMALIFLCPMPAAERILLASVWFTRHRSM